MSHKIDLDSFDEFILNKSKDSNLTYSLPNNIGLFECSRDNIQKDILLFKTDAKVNINDLIVNSSSQVSGLYMIINLEGNIIHTDKTDKSKLLFNKGDMITKYINNYEGGYEFKNETNIKSLCLLIRDDFLEKYLLNHLDNKSELDKKYKDNISSQLRKSIANHRLQSLAYELYNSPFEGDLNQLFMQSKALEFIYEEFNSIINEQNGKCSCEICSCDKLNIDDINALYKAKELIEKADRFYTLSELCKKVALNEFKLKYGFKKVFKTTPGQMILNLKMQKAKELLLSQNYNVSEVSRMVGYKYQQSFTNAFIKCFNTTPKSLIKSKNYYDFS
ncbi:AraC family transcriptional regulator [Halarcobacter mediterraneus]|uniref:AraC family transcriptional regulator n=1 Tax=Halarcobacter mediterraneus TaxID=2023153 RepID=A0A4Q1ATR8_9BACT|nr:response regulator transcription factor [Halarcobacter mediterraneus]RXK13282.1 AraC family transcriptional regulator [Halarcobacter mediterraneus]